MGVSRSGGAEGRTGGRLSGVARPEGPAQDLEGSSHRGGAPSCRGSADGSGAKRTESAGGSNARGRQDV